MSARVDRPDDFVRWLAEHHPVLADPDGFAPRRLFGLYVQARLAEVEAAHPGRIHRVVGEVMVVQADGVRLADQTLVAADAVVLTTGNPAPGTASARSERILPDPWAPRTLDRIGADDDILVIGTGLTMVDVLLSLDARGWRGRATALSRRGLVPRSHAPRPDTPIPPTEALRTGPLSRRLAEARRLSDLGGWRELMEGLRPVTADLWTRSDQRIRGQVVRHLRPWWDVHRHRVAPDVAAVLERLVAQDRLRIVAGRAGALTADTRAMALEWSPRHGPRQPALTGRWLIDCTGPGHAPDRDPLTAPLIASGRARLDPLNLGLDLDPMGRVLDARGAADDRLFVLGPPARAAFWETIAVPDIRKRIEDVVQGLS